VHPQGSVSLRPEYDAWLARPNKRLWWYQSCDQHESCANGTPGPADSTWPSYMVDASPVRNRIFQWMAFLYKIQGELYYQVDYCWTATDCASPDPWVSVYAFGGNGDGTLFYPGTPDRIGGNAPIPVASIRLKLIRDEWKITSISPRWPSPATQPLRKRLRGHSSLTPTRLITIRTHSSRRGRSSGRDCISAFIRRDETETAMNARSTTEYSGSGPDL
jgi:hypothetical protein